MQSFGFGIGLRSDHYQDILEDSSRLDFVEAISENYMHFGTRGRGRPFYYLEKVREKLPVVLHGVSLSIGSTDPLRKDYLQSLKELIADISPRWISDHLCWTGAGGRQSHDLLPLPMTEETLVHVVDRVRQVQDFLGRQIALENLSSYLEFQKSTIPEWEFLAEVAKRADCHLLLDVNNVYVSSVNHSFDPQTYIRAVPAERVQLYHLAGHSTHEGYLIDTHDQRIVDPVWSLYSKTVEVLGHKNTLIERDDHIPPFSELLEEVDVARKVVHV